MAVEKRRSTKRRKIVPAYAKHGISRVSLHERSQMEHMTKEDWTIG